MAILQPLLWGGGEEYTSLPGDVFFQRISPVLPCAEASQKTIMTAITLMRDERVCVCVCVNKDADLYTLVLNVKVNGPDVRCESD